MDAELTEIGGDATHFATDGPAPRRSYDDDTAAAVVCVLEHVNVNFGPHCCVLVLIVHAGYC